MKRPKVVIGAAYGDEGKGTVVDALTSSDSLVVRFNGGSQAGHTVVNKGRRHVFSTFGAGTFNGARTHLSRFFVFSPFEFLEESKQLRSLGLFPKLSASPQCLVTTPCDVSINTLVEEARGKDRHGSVGVGFGETIERSERYPDFAITLRDFLSPSYADKVDWIWNEWTPLRMKELGLVYEKSSRSSCDMLSDAMKQVFCLFASQIGSFLNLAEDSTVFDSFDGDKIVFEGAQGLMLDQDNRADFPYLTRSNTGLKNVYSLMGDVELDVYYVTRAYTTRHGAGPFPHERTTAPYMGVSDKTNKFSPFQGELRYSYLDLDIIRKSVKKDMDVPMLKAGRGSCCGVMTCLDQVDYWIGYILDGCLTYCTAERLPSLFQDVVGIPLFCGVGSLRKDVPVA